MRSIARLFSAFGTLAESILSLSGVLDAATGRLRQQLALDEAAATVLDHQPAGGEECRRGWQRHGQEQEAEGWRLRRAASEGNENGQRGRLPPPACM